MPKIKIPYPLSNNADFLAADVTANLQALEDAVNALDEENLEGGSLAEVSGGGRKIFMDLTNGHNHDGTNSPPLGVPTAAIKGGLRTKIVEVAESTPVADLNGGALDYIVMWQLFWENGAAGTSDYIDSIPGGSGLVAGDGLSSKNLGSVHSSDFGPEIAIDEVSIPNRIWATGAAPGTGNYTVMLLGY